MTTVAVLPIKALDSAKRRLADALDAGTRRALVQAMFADVLVALRRCALLHRVVVVSGDHGAQRIAGGYGALVVGDRDRGHNAAAAAGVSEALRLGAQRVLLVAGDCPLIDPAQVDELLAADCEPPCVAIVPDRHGDGTNALLIAPPDAVRTSFGPGSHNRHHQQAAAAGVAARTVHVPGLAFDVDTPDDLDAVRELLERTRGGAAHTRGMLRQLSRS